MRATGKTLAMAAFCAVIWHQASLAQVAPVTILEIDLENRVNYISDVFDITKFATVPTVTTPLATSNFRTIVHIGDIVAVNGKPVKGTNVANFRAYTARPSPTPGQAIGDATEDIMLEQTFQILQPDGTLIGSIMVAGLGNGLTPPGAPSGVLLGDAVIVGGTGAFLGARGESGAGRVLAATRNASVTEDPASRRRNGGGAARGVLHLIPMSRPEIVSTANGPAIVHSNDFTLVTSSKPAKAGEILSLIATGLGPTRPGVDPGKPFPANPLAAVNSPVDVTVNGKPAEVIGAVGYPGAVDAYQVNVRLPPDTAPGLATLQLSAAWITGSGVGIAVAAQ